MYVYVTNVGMQTNEIKQNNWYSPWGGRGRRQCTNQKQKGKRHQEPHKMQKQCSKCRYGMWHGENAVSRYGRQARCVGIHKKVSYKL